MFITNDFTKFVTMNGTTASNFPGSLNVSNLTIAAAGGAVNTLNVIGITPTPFHIINSLMIEAGGALALTNGTLLLQNTPDMYGYSATAGEVNGALSVTTGGSFVATNRYSHFYVGNNSQGQVLVNGGSAHTYSLEFSPYYASQPVPGARGVMTVVGGSLTVDSTVIITGPSAIWVTGGNLTVPNDITTIGDFGTGSLTVSNGNVQLAETDIGLYGTFGASHGNLTIVGGTTTLSGPLDVAVNNGSSGVVWMAGGRLVVTNAPTYIGDVGTGEMTMSNGTFLGREMWVGRNSFSTGTLTMWGGTISLNSWMKINQPQDGLTGAVWISGGTLLVTNDALTIAPAGSCQMTVSNGAVQTRDLLISSGLFGSHGTLTLVGGATQLSGNLIVSAGSSFNNTGAAWLLGGSLTTTGAAAIVGSVGAGQMTISNGVWLTRDLIVATNAAVVGRLTIAGGTITALSQLLVGDCTANAVALINLSGGNLFVTNATHTATLEIRSGSFTITGGNLVADRIVMTNSCGHFNRNGGTVSIGSLVLDPALDADSDGIPNGWEQAHGLDPLNAADANADPDGDGFTNLQEFLAGTDPNNNASAFRITAVARTNNNLRVTWTMGSGKTNALQRAAGNAYNTNSFTDIFIVTNTVGTTTNYLDVGAATNFPSRFYRVRLVP